VEVGQAVKEGFIKVIAVVKASEAPQHFNEGSEANN
jgi:hypothetical protein